MVYSWRTRRDREGFTWEVTFAAVTGHRGKWLTTVVQSGRSKTRDRAVRQAKRWVTLFRRGGTLYA
jgi:hypothetical protein